MHADQAVNSDHQINAHRNTENRGLLPDSAKRGTGNPQASRAGALRHGSVTMAVIAGVMSSSFPGWKARARRAMLEQRREFHKCSNENQVKEQLCPFVSTMA